MSITLLMFAETLTPRGLFPPGFYINFSYSISLYSIKAPAVQNCGCFWDKFSGVGFQLPGRQAEGLHGLAVQLDHVTGTALLAAHGAHLAVHLHGTALHQLLGFAAGLAQACVLEQGIQLDKFR